jgi:hypothetical protein
VPTQGNWPIGLLTNGAAGRKGCMHTLLDDGRWAMGDG